MDSYTEKFQNAIATFNFSDFILLPGFSQTRPRDINLSARFSKHIPISIPIVASPMDTVTEAAMAIALARKGGIGVLHRNCSTEEEVEMAKAVKRAESFIIRDVITTSRSTAVETVLAMMKKYNISGLPVLEENKLVGIITNRDVRLADPARRVEEVMTKDVISTREGVKEDEAISVMNQNRIEKLPVTDGSGNFVGLITYKDIKLRERYGNALRDENGRLMVAAAVSPFDLDRAMQLSKHVDALLIDVAHFHSQNVIEGTRKIINETGIDVVIGSFGTKEGVLDCVTRLEGAAGLRVGIGSGSICTTTDVTRAGSPTLFAVAQAADALREIGSDLPIIADGGIRTAGDIALTMAFGASSSMLGYLLAGCKESPSKTTMVNNKYYKLHRGMGSRAAREKRAIVDRYADSGGKNIEEGIEILVPYSGELENVIDELTSGIRAAMGYAGASNIDEMKGNARVAKVDARMPKAGIRTSESVL